MGKGVSGVQGALLRVSDFDKGGADSRTDGQFFLKLTQSGIYIPFESSKNGRVYIIK